MPIAVKKKNNIVNDGNIMDYAASGKILVFKKYRTRLSKYINEIKNNAIGALSQFYRFKPLPTKIQSHLVKEQAVVPGSFLLSLKFFFLLCNVFPVTPLFAFLPIFYSVNL